jgi:hypothetical protein
VCIATGPSLTVEDVETVRASGARVIVVNDALHLAPWADMLVFLDTKWAEWHRTAVQAFPGLTFTLQPSARRYGTLLRNTGNSGLETDPTGLRSGWNSGYAALNVAYHTGATTLVLLGYDMQPGPGGESHYFGDHPDRCQPHYPQCQPLFQTLADPLRAAGVTVLNASRRSAIGVWPRVSLDEALAAVPHV